MSAKTGQAGEWIQIDLKETCKVHAIQINFAEEQLSNMNRADDYYLFRLSGSVDGENWMMIQEQTEPGVSNPHAYIELQQSQMLRYVKLENKHMAFGGKFAVRAIRVFGKKAGDIPKPVTRITVKRDYDDPRNATIIWETTQGAERYLVRYGTQPDRMEQSRVVENRTELTIGSFNRDVTYYLQIDSMNRSGVCKGHQNIAF